MRPVGVMFKLTLREAARRKVLWGLIILCVLFLPQRAARASH